MKLRLLISLLLLIFSCTPAPKKVAKPLLSSDMPVSDSAAPVQVADDTEYLAGEHYADSMFDLTVKPALKERKKDTSYYVAGRYKLDTISYRTRYLGCIQTKGYKEPVDILHVFAVFAWVGCPHASNMLYFFHKGKAVGLYNHMDFLHFQIKKDAVLFTSDSCSAPYGTTAINFRDSFPSQITLPFWDEKFGAYIESYTFQDR
ncbi:hypothetical protein [Chitinophaga sp. Cy-1792]|uniref:hypothetical protein n=1 Tax=Chitinophaga sp. Cy-1792 TaxID=2608339 RepID=UPI00141F584D|nr:hypothetical protein [Chitinophaga sp. Cy-1792]NIG53968.1 hypothetical protein [Chitinophaga sp. Cy-1792]